MRRENTETVASLIRVVPTCLCLQSNPEAVSRGVSQPDRVNEEPPDLFSEEASRTSAKPNGVHSDDDNNDLFAGQETFSHFIPPGFYVKVFSASVL